ncbi:MAG TPA: hypothetical protein VFG28_02510 [Syntrophales bacterium]|nr:hypothetical protein [Syntrophales bacterium]
MMESIIQNLFSTQDGVIWLAVKWVVIVAAAGFIGQFGKAFASYLMGRARQRRARSPQHPPGADLKEDAPQKAALREEPSSGRMETAQAPVQPVAEPAVGQAGDKKNLKAQAKQQKKALKGLKKLFK